ncbi:MAG TPA: YraN family protein [Pirellulales bacterium]|nr:YraN family protein [Pirellulales bacterium]
MSLARRFPSRWVAATRVAAVRLSALWHHWRPEPSLGERGEQAAARFLRQLGYRVVDRRHRTALGEIDLVAVDGRTVVFVEVKTRRSDDAGRPHEAIDPAKQARLSRLALAYLKRHDLLDCPARFDVVAVTWLAGSKQPAIEHFLNAFESAF